MADHDFIICLLTIQVITFVNYLYYYSFLFNHYLITVFCINAL